MSRIGVFICHCGENIAKTVDCPQLAKLAAEIPGVVHAEDYRYTCSEPGQSRIKQAIIDHKLTGVVVGACSPRMHEKTFRKAAQAAGLNPYLCEIANLREQCSWVHSDRTLATAKAFDILRATVARVERNIPLNPIKVPMTRKALVIGGGIAGIQAALDIADAGNEVILVERSPSLGGHMAQLSETFPTLDCSQCIMTPRMVEAASHPKIRLETYAEVELLEGYVGNFTATIRRKAAASMSKNAPAAEHAGRSARKRKSPAISTKAWANAPPSASPSPKPFPTSPSSTAPTAPILKPANAASAKSSAPPAQSIMSSRMK